LIIRGVLGFLLSRGSPSVGDPPAVLTMRLLSVVIITSIFSVGALGHPGAGLTKTFFLMALAVPSPG